MSEARKRAGIALRVLLAVVGLVVVAYLVEGAGPARVMAVLWQAGSWLPLIVVLEVFQLTCDYGALRAILGRDWHRVPVTSIVRSSSLAYAMMTLLPAGRAAGEIARATILSKSIGVPRAAMTGTQMQATYLSANGLLSAAAWAVVASRLGPKSVLALLLAGNVLCQALISGGLVAIVWDARVGRWLDRQRRRLLGLGENTVPLDPSLRRRLPWRASIVCSIARASQVAQYGVILHAVGGDLSVQSAFVAHGIHLVGSTLGDFLPNQVGVVDGAYRAFAGVLGFANAPERALSIAFVARITQLLCASACIVVAALTRGATPEARPLSERVAPARTDADAHL